VPAVGTRLDFLEDAGPHLVALVLDGRSPFISRNG
jgi:hypothetical protein